MELFSKLLLLEAKIEKLISEVKEARDLKDNIQLDYNQLFEKYRCLEEENKNLKEDRDKVKELIEKLIFKISQ